MKDQIEAHKEKPLNGILSIPDNQKQNKKSFLGKLWKTFFIFVLGLGLLTLVYYFLATPSRVSGNPLAPFKGNQLILSEKITYLFRSPKIGDRVTFETLDNVSFNFIGIITGMSFDNNVTQFTIRSSPGRPWIISPDRIRGKIYYPFVSDSEVQEVLILPTPIPVSEAIPFLPPAELNPTFVTESTPSPTPNQISPKRFPRQISIAGFVYEDINDDGKFNSTDYKLPNMQFFLYDSSSPETQISTIYSNQEGNFSITLNIAEGLIIKPTTYNNFRPKSGQITVSASTQGIEFGFRSASAPVQGQNGKIEGDIFQDSNRNNLREDGEKSVYFYKLYLQDSSGNYYNTDQNAQTTDPSGHFRFLNLPVGKTYTLRLSNPTGDYIMDKPETNITLTATQTESTNIQIPVYKTVQ